jgi:hypothetical protein
MKGNLMNPRQFGLWLTKSTLALLIATFVSATPLKAREWRDATGQFSIQGDVVAADKTTVAIDTKSRGIVMFHIDQLSDKDQEFLESAVGADGKILLGSEELVGSPSEVERTNGPVRDWKLTSGDVLTGEVVGYFSGDIELLREKNEVLVDRVQLTDLPKIYDAILPGVLNREMDAGVTRVREINAWLKKNGGGPFNLKVRGVEVRIQPSEAAKTSEDTKPGGNQKTAGANKEEASSSVVMSVGSKATESPKTRDGGATRRSGDVIVIPAFMLSEEDRKIIEPGLERWMNDQAYHDDQEREYSDSRSNVSLQMLMNQRYQNRLAEQQVQMMQLGLMVAAGGLELWEVEVSRPNNTVYGYRTSVVIPARNSLAAQQIAQKRYPGWTVGAAANMSGG